MERKAPVIKKTKKSSYKPLSKLNQDNLTDLTRVEKPEYMARVFFYNSATRAQLVNNVNVWFRDHQHNLTLINRQQQSLCKLMVRRQNDVHRVKRDGYKRRQQEIRDGMHKLRMSMLLRRAVLRFRQNAADRMAARGESHKSACGRRLRHAQRRWGVVEDPGLGEPPLSLQDLQKGKSMLESIAAYAAIISADRDEKEDGGAERVDELNECSADSGVDSAGEAKSSVKSKTNDCKNSSAKSTEQNGNKEKVSQQQKSSRKSSDPDSPHGVSNSSTQAGSRNRSSRTSTLSKHISLDVIPESEGDVTSHDTESQREDSSWAEKSSLCRDGTKGDDSSPVPLRTSRVVEVRKDRPNSPSTKTVTMTSRQASDTSPKSRASSQDLQEGQGHGHGHGQGHEDSVSRTVTFRDVPDRDKALRDASVFLPGSEEGDLVSDDGEDGDGEGKDWRKTRSIAARVRLERKRAARRRAQVLDSEPLVQYYRSMRGTLLPLLTEPSRRSFPLPSGRHKYQQTKLLRDEQQRDLDRRQHIDRFFSDLFAQQMGEAAPHQQRPKEDSAADKKPGVNGLDFLLKKIRRGSEAGRLSQSVAGRTSLDKLSECQYLRVYDWDSKAKRGKDDGQVVKLTSWANAENRLKAGFLALNFAGHS